MSDIFKVVPLCDRQKRDVNPNDILNNGLYRKCDVYKGGGGYDRFPQICKKRLGYDYRHQFVVQLYGCPLRCPYCYVTSDGVFGKYIEVSSSDMVEAFEISQQDVFHLMGGAPALYIEDWLSIIEKINIQKVFHSDLLLIEKEYPSDVLHEINKENTIYAVNIKGLNGEFKKNTGVEMKTDLFWHNLNLIIKSEINFYFTFTGLPLQSVQAFKYECISKGYSEAIFNDSFLIDIIQYDALKN